MKIIGFNKLTLLDYPNKMAAAVFIGGCNFDCGFCHNSSLINVTHNDTITKQEVLAYLTKRKNILEGVCLTGGEPLLSNDLENFILDIKNIKNYKIKLDTNGTSPKRLQQLIANNLIDYVAMDIKNSLSKYEQTAKAKINTDSITDSIKIIIETASDYEFRTTLIKEHHTRDDFIQMLQLIKKAKRYALQGYVESEQVREKGLTAFNEQQMKEFANIAKSYVNELILRN